MGLLWKLRELLFQIGQSGEDLSTMPTDNFNGELRPMGHRGKRQFVLLSTKNALHPRATLSADQVRHVRRCMKNAEKEGSGVKSDVRRFLSLFLGCSEHTVSEIHRGKRFSSVED
jgi:hypothetical protein